MAKFKMELPKEILQQMERIEADCETIFGEMAKAGAETVMQNVRSSAPSGIRNSKMMDCLVMTRIYKTPSDDGINCKVAFYGYFDNENGVRTPAPLVGNVFEYGRSGLRFPKQPFMRACFNEGQIKSVMLKTQRELSGGLLEDE